MSKDELNYDYIGFFKQTSIYPLLILIFICLGACAYYGTLFFRYESLSKELQKTIFLTQFANNIYNERSVNSIYIATKSKLDNQIVETAYQKTDESLQVLKQAYSDTQTNLVTPEILYDFRQKVSHNESDFFEMFFDDYGVITNFILDETKALQNYSLDPQITSFLISIYYTVDTMDKIATRRDFLAPAMIENRSLTQAELKIWNQINTQNDFYSKILNDKEVQKDIHSIYLKDDFIKNTNEMLNFISSVTNKTDIYKMDFSNLFILLDTQTKAANDILKILFDKTFSITKQQEQMTIVFFSFSCAMLILFLCLFVVSLKKRSLVTKSLREVNLAIKQIDKVIKQNNIELKTKKGIKSQFDFIKEAIFLYNEDKNDRRKRQLEEDLFFKNITNNIKEPLQAILAYAQILKKSQNLEQKQITNLDNIIFSIKDLKRKFDDIIAISRIKSKTLSINNETFMPVEAFSSVMDELMPYAIQKGVRLLCLVDPRLENELEGDIEKIEKIIKNLISTIIDLSEIDNIVLLRIEAIKQLEKNKIIKISVIDNSKLVTQYYKDNDLVANLDQIDDSKRSKFGIASEYAKYLGSKLEFYYDFEKVNEVSFELELVQRSFKLDSLENKFQGIAVGFFESDYDKGVLNTRYGDISYFEILKSYLSYMGIKCIKAYDENEDFKYAFTTDPTAVFKKHNSIFAYSNAEVLAGSRAQITGVLSIEKLTKVLSNLENVKKHKPADTSSKIMANVLAVTDFNFTTKLKLLCSNVINLIVLNKRYDIIFIDLKELSYFDKNQSAKKMLIKLSKTFPTINVISTPSDIDSSEFNFMPDTIKQNEITNEKIAEIINKYKLQSRKDIKDILLFKSSKVLNNIFSRALSGFATLSSVDNMQQLREELNNEAYRLVLVDDNIEEFDEEQLFKIISLAKIKHKTNIQIGLFKNTNRTYTNNVAYKFDLIINSLSQDKTRLENIIKQHLR
nr:HAMP domain-containing histidine kinase [Campylobacter sp.]